MATSYPGSIDALVNPSGTSTLSSPSHADQHGNANDAVEALETKLGTGASTPTTVGHVLTVTGVGATAYSTPAGGGSSVLPYDQPPASPHPSDDEFNTTDTTDPMSGWTTIGVPTAHDINSTKPGHYYVRKDAVAGVNWVGICKAAPAMPFTVTTKLSSLHLRDNFNAAALLIMASPTGAIETLGIRQTLINLELDTFTSPTGGGAFVANFNAMHFSIPFYLRAVVASSTNVTYQYSPDGYIWYTLLSARNPGFVIGNIGIACDSENATHKGEATFDWIRFS